MKETPILKEMPKEEWRAHAAAHADRTENLTRAHLERKARNIKHPIEDFLFTYYNLTPAQMRRWHPGAQVVLADASERHDWKWYKPHKSATGENGATVDVATFFEKRGPTVNYIEKLLSATLSRPPAFGCFGMHEWAMVYKMSPEEIRHRGLSLRLGALETDFVVEETPILCTHFDAFRFFTPEAAPLNQLSPTRDNQPQTEQSGCLHAGMDVYKWTMKLGPIVSGELLLDTFELARDIRQVDMQASPYDVSEYGLPPVAVETPEGKAEYALLQRGFTNRGNVLRERVLTAIKTARNQL